MQKHLLASSCLAIVSMMGCGGSATPAATTTPVVSTPTPTVSFPSQTFDYVAYAQTGLPAYYRGNSPVGNADNTPATNPITNAAANLGRVLFYDKNLSVNNTIACASCHQQSHGFSDSARLSAGFAGGQTARHAMGLTNARYYIRGHFFWDERANTLEDQVLQPIQNSVEMGMTLGALETKLAAISYYPPLFQAAFGTPEVTSNRISLALAQFVRSMVSYGSKYDQALASGVNGNPNFAAVFTPQEQRGEQIFQNVGCARCHGTDAHIAATVKNNGLDAVNVDLGAGNGQFKVPSLRNIGARGPYMHDGRFSDLEQVIEFYNSGVQDNPNLSPELRVNGNGPVRRLNLTDQQKADLKAFLLTLTDNAFLSDPRFASPF